MARSPFQSDFVVTREPAAAPVELPPGTDPVALPRAALQSNEASARSVKWVYILMFVMLGALALITAIGPHIPAGE
ncbi:MAG: hypothetical protein JNL83_35890 [Myxococcales bacterium]|nr:hypothetical protein [Myxococcales bacterium]